MTIDYSNVYRNFISGKDHGVTPRKKRRKRRIEIHHVLPKSMGGADDPGNYAYLTHTDHVMAHIIYSIACFQKGMDMRKVPQSWFGRRSPIFVSKDLVMYWNPLSKIRISLTPRKPEDGTERVMTLKNACRFMCGVEQAAESTENVNRWFDAILRMCVSGERRTYFGYRFGIAGGSSEPGASLTV